MMARMLARLMLIGVTVATLWSGAAQAVGHTLYAASVRSGAGVRGDTLLAGNLYTINLANGNASLVGPIRMAGNKHVGVTGMAAHPSSGLLYGITAEQSPNFPHSLVTIDPVTANATLVGDLGVHGSDIAFDSKGTLYIWLPTTSRLGTVNLSNAQITPLGRPGPQGSPAGIAIDLQDMVYVTAKGAGGTLDNVDLSTGALQVGPPLTGAPFATQINSMCFSPSGLLLAVNSNGGSPASTKLVTINTATGAVNAIGSLPDDTDALAFVGAGANVAPTFSTLNPGLRVVVAVISTVLVVLAITIVLRRRR